MMKEANPDCGVAKISDLLLRGPALPASPQAVARVLHEADFAGTLCAVEIYRGSRRGHRMANLRLILR